MATKYTVAFMFSADLKYVALIGATNEPTSR